MGTKRTTWEVRVRPPNKAKRQRNWVLVRYPPSGAVDETGRRYRSESWSSGTEDHEEAVAEARRVEAKLNAACGLLADETVSSVVEAYLAGNELSESYATNCLSAIKAAPMLRSLGIHDISRAKVTLARDQMRPGRSNSTVNGYIRALRAAWNWAELRGMVSVPWPKLRRLPAKSSKSPYEAYEVGKLLDWLQENPRGFTDWYAYFSLLADTGLRPGELVRLKGEHVDRIGCRLLISRNKSGRQGQKRIEEWVRVPRATMELLPEREPGLWLWPSRGVQARGHVTVNGARLALQKALKACGIPHKGKLDQYSFRRWWIDAADDAQVSLGDAMKQTGHRKAETHLGYRRNSRRAVSQAAVEKVHRYRLAPQAAPQERAEQAQRGEPSAAAAGGYPASSLCSR